MDDDGFVVLASPDGEVLQGEIHRGVIQIRLATGVTALVEDPFDDEPGMVARQLFALFLVEGIEDVIDQVLGKLDLFFLANPHENLDEVFDAGPFHRDLVRNAPEKGLVHQVGRRKIGRKYHQLVERD